MSHQQKHIARLLFLVALMLGAGELISGTSILDAKERPHAFDTSENAQRSVLVSDRSVDPAEEVAREILQLQQQLGGSVVSDRPQLQGWPTQPPRTPQHSRGSSRQPKGLARPAYPRSEANHPNHRHPSHGQVDTHKNSQPPTKVAMLRDSAWQLDTTAHRLEHLELYDQADALRELADRFRHDARAMKTLEKPAVEVE